MVIPIDTLLIKQLRKLLNVILAISIITWQDEKWIEFYSGEYVNSDRYRNTNNWSSQRILVLFGKNIMPNKENKWCDDI